MHAAILLIFVADITQAVDCEPYTPTRLDPVQARADVQLAFDALQEIHPGWDRYTPRSILERAFEELHNKCDRGLDDRQLFAELSRAVALLRCSHTKLEPSEAWAQWRSSSPSYLPCRFAYDGSRMVVTDSADARVPRGSEILAIDGRASSEILGAIQALVPADGFTDHARRFALGGVSDLDDCEFDHFYPFLFPIEESLRLELLAPGQGRSKEVLIPWKTREARESALRRQPTPRNMDESVSLDLSDPRAAVLRIGTFVAYRKLIRPESILGPCFRQIDEAGSRALILDLRDNGGGSDDAAEALLRFMIREPIPRISRARLRIRRLGKWESRVETWDRSLLERPFDDYQTVENGFFELLPTSPGEVKPLQPGFRGSVYALCGPANASGATICLAALKELAGATLVGSPTGGAVDGPTAGLILFLQLPHSGHRLRVPVVRTMTRFSRFTPGLGLAPDILVDSSIEDTLAGRDPVLERALELAGAATQ